MLESSVAFSFDCLSFNVSNKWQFTGIKEFKASVLGDEYKE